MANTVTVTTLLEGPRNLVLHVYLKSDGVSGDLSNEVIADPANHEFLSDSRYFTLEDVTYGFNGFSANLEFEYLMDNTLIWVLPPGSGNYVDFKKFGGLADRSDVDGTGKLLLNTTGLMDEGDEGSLIIKLKK